MRPEQFIIVNLSGRGDKVERDTKGNLTGVNSYTTPYAILFIPISMQTCPWGKNMSASWLPPLRSR